MLATGIRFWSVAADEIFDLRFGSAGSGVGEHGESVFDGKRAIDDIVGIVF